MEKKVSSKPRTKWTKVAGFVPYKEYIWPNQCVCCFGPSDATSTLVSGLDKVLVDSGLAKIGESGNVQVEYDSYNKKYVVTVHVPYCKDCKKHDKWGNAARGMIGCAASIVGFFAIGLLIVLIFVGASELKSGSFARLPIPAAIIFVLLLGGYFLKRIAGKKKKESCAATASGLFTPFPVRPLINERGVIGVEFAQQKYGEAFAQANQLRFKTQHGEVEEPQLAGSIPELAEKCGGCGLSKDLQLVYDKKKNRGYLCNLCKDRYQTLLQPDSDRNFWMCKGCNFRVLAGTDIDARVDELLSKCPNCHADLNLTLVNLKDDREIDSGIVGEPLD